MTSRECLYAVALIFLAAGSTSSQSHIAEADRYVKLGTRLAPLPPGEGGQLIVSAPPELCADGSLVLEVRGDPEPPGIRPVARLLTGPSSCRWTFDGVEPGEFHAVVQAQADGRIVATGHAHVARGVTTEMTLEAVQMEIEGRLTIEGFTFESFPLASDLRLVFGFPDFPTHEWSASLDATGRYRVKVGGVDADRRICAQIRRAPPLNSKMLQGSESRSTCAIFVPGLNRFDIEGVRIPPGVLRIDVPAVADAPFDAFVRVTGSADGQPTDHWFMPFKALRGIRGNYIADLNRRYTIELTGHDGSDVLASAQVTLTSDQPVADIKLAAKRVR
jgi:hypothetical protein